MISPKCVLSLGVSFNQFHRFVQIFYMYSDISEKWTEQCDPMKPILESLDLQQFGLQKMQRDLNSQFRVVSYITQTEDHVEKLDKDPEHFSGNRYAGILPFDKNRVLLGSEGEKKQPENYMNANFIQVCGHKCIATQGPLHSTINNFWKMIEENKVAAIFMLCERIQKTKVKCDLYWPTSQDSPLKTQKNSESTEPQYQYQVRYCGVEEEKYLKKRNFKLFNLQTKQTHEVVQYQILGWHDGEAPDPKIKKTLSKTLDIMISHLQNDQMTVVHCSAGVGRTGTFIAMSQIKMLIGKVEKISIFECVRKLREQRWSMVRSAGQYQYLYDYTEKEANKYYGPKIEGQLDGEQSD